MNPATPVGIAASLPVWILLLCGVFALVTPAIAWIGSALIVGSGRGSRWQRAGAPFRTVGVWVLVAVLLERLLGQAVGAPGGPEGWADAWNAALANPAGGFWGTLARVTGWSLQFHPLTRDLAFPFAALCGLWTLPVTVFSAFSERNAKDAPNYQVPYGGTVAAIAAAGAAFGLLELGANYATSGPRVGIDSAAALPTALVCFALWALSARSPAPEAAKTEETSEPAVLERPDIVERWRKVGALDADSKPIAAAPAQRGDGGSREVREAWKCVGAAAAPPQSLDQIAAVLDEPGQAWVVGDLPDPTESLFNAAIVLLAAQERGLPSLIITDEPKALRARVESGLQSAGAWRYGPLVVGEEELRLELEKGRMPAAAFLDLRELSARGIRALWNCLTPPATAWTRTIGLVIVSRIDRGTPLEATHRFFALRRLALVLSAAGTRYSVLATGMGGAGSLHFAGKVFTTAKVSDVPFAPRSVAPVKVWQALDDFVAKPGEPWPKRASKSLVAELGLSVAVGDPTGRFDSSLSIWGGDMPVRRDVTLEGSASIGALDDAWLVAGWRSLPNRVPLADGSTHHALWAWEQSPVTRFLIEKDNLRRLDRGGHLLTPRSLVGSDNTHVARAHLEAALREGRQDRESLAAYFGGSLTDQVLEPTVTAHGHSLRRTPSSDRLIRVTTVPAQTGSLDDVLRDTVTGDAIQVKDRAGGRILARCDRAMIETRYYPGRVFATQDARYEVKQLQLDHKRSELLVDRVDSDRMTTRPDIDVYLQIVACVDPPQTITDDQRQFVLATYDVTVTEQISRYFHSDGTRVDYSGKVTAQYRTRARAILFPRPAADETHRHLAACFDRMLLAHLLAGDDDIHVVPVAAGLSPGLPAGIVAIDRHVGGMGVADALDISVVKSLFRWIRPILTNCACTHGCEKCTPVQTLRSKPNKMEVLRLLGA